MAVSPYTEKWLGENRGPHLLSEDYNKRVEQNYRDLVYLYNAVGQMTNAADFAYSAAFKQLESVINKLDEIDARLDALEAVGNNLVFYSEEQIDIARFDATAFKLSDQVDRNTFHHNYGIMTLPYVDSSSMSKVRFINDDGTFNVANGLETVVVPVTPSADDNDATVQTSSPYDAIQAKPGLVWERNVISPTADANAQCYLYVRIPNELSVTANTNGIMFTPFPVFDVDITEISYSVDPNVPLSNSGTWTPLNQNAWYSSNVDAVGHVPPGGWIGDTSHNAGPSIYYFEPKPITAFRIKFSQNSYWVRSNKYLYSYGLSKLDVRYDKFQKTGKTIVRLDAPSGKTISKINSVSPKIWNVSQASLNNVFSYRTIWETSFNSGSYTLNPVALSKRVWLEITLNQVTSGFTPVLSSVIVNYT